MRNFCRLLSLPIGLRIVHAAAASSSLEIQNEEVPALPVEKSNRDSAKDPMHEAVVSGVMNNPAVILGLGLTTVALLGMIRKSYTGDRLGAQRFMQYRIMAQFFTLIALIFGVAYFTFKFEREEKEKNQKDV